MAMALPELFAKTSHSTRVKTSHLINKYKHLINWKNNASILEFGFGDGGNSQKSLKPILPVDYKEFVATDTSKEMVDFATKRVNMPRCEFSQLDISSTNIPENFNNRFDNIFSFFTNHFVKPKQMFKNVHHMLKSDGQTFQISFVEGPLDIVFQILSKHPKWGIYKHEKHISDMKNCEADLVAAGFKKYSIDIEELMYEFPDEEEWKGLYFSANPVAPFIPREEVDEYKEVFFEEVRKHTLISEEDGHGGIVYKLNTPYYVICATKGN